MDAAWSVLGATTEVNSWRIYLNCAPHVLLPILDIASANFVPFLITYCRCDRKRSFWSKITPRYRASDVGWMVMLPRVIGADVLILLFRVKWTRRYLDGSNCIRCFCLQHSASVQGRTSGTETDHVTRPITALSHILSWFFMVGRRTQGFRDFGRSGNLSIISEVPTKPAREVGFVALFSYFSLVSS